MFSYNTALKKNKWLNYRWPYTDRSPAEWMKYQKYPKQWASHSALRDYVMGWVNKDWLKDSWGNNEIWQGLDVTLNDPSTSDTSSNTNIAYGSESWQTLDVFTPSGSGTETKPVLVFFYGGGWHDGTKEKYRYVANTFTKLGYVVVIPDYVKYPTGRFPDFIHDGAKALSWVKAHIGEYGGDLQNLFVAGHSAGAHLGALLATDPKYLTEVGMQKTDIKAFAGLAGPYDFVPLIKRYKDVFDDPSRYPDIQVSNFVDGSESPMMIAQAGSDMIVGTYTNEPLLKALKSANVPLESPNYSGMGHMGIVLALSSSYGQDGTVINDMHQFFQKHTQPHTSLN